jgi:alkylhydroperoxidase/carboxymuconolactone decarboxylase family protein YurZ
MIARGQAPALIYYADQAIENGVKPLEISETITHLAYYTRAVQFSLCDTVCQCIIEV